MLLIATNRMRCSNCSPGQQCRSRRRRHRSYLSSLQGGRGHARDTFGRWRDTDDVPRLAPAARAVPRRCRYQYAHRLQFCADLQRRRSRCTRGPNSMPSRSVSTAPILRWCESCAAKPTCERSLSTSSSFANGQENWAGPCRLSSIAPYGATISAGIAKLAGFCRELGIDQLLLTEGLISTAHNYTVPDTLDTLKNDDILLFGPTDPGCRSLIVRLRNKPAVTRSFNARASANCSRKCVMAKNRKTPLPLSTTVSSSRHAVSRGNRRW